MLPEDTTAKTSLSNIFLLSQKYGSVVALAHTINQNMEHTTKVFFWKGYGYEANGFQIGFPKDGTPEEIEESLIKSLGFLFVLNSIWGIPLSISQKEIVQKLKIPLEKGETKVYLFSPYKNKSLARLQNSQGIMTFQNVVKNLESKNVKTETVIGD